MTPTLWIDGAPAKLDDLTHIALTNYGAYTSFRVESGGVRGLDLHLARLDAAAVELFGAPVGEAKLREFMRQALGVRTEAWVRVSLFSLNISHRRVSASGPPNVMVGVFDPPPPLAAGMRLQLQTYEREAPHLKHSATFGLVRARRAARAAGFDDALFVTRDGFVSEGSLWNIGFLKGDVVIWPDAPMLRGVAQALIEKTLPARGLSMRRQPIRVEDVHAFDAAFICNSATPACAVTSIDGHAYADASRRLAEIAAAWAANAPQPI